MFNEKGNYQYPGDMVKSTYDSNNDGVVNAADSVPWSGVTNTPDTLSGYGIEDVPASVLSGVIDIAHLPPSAVERMKIVENDSMRFALTTADVQNGDTVKVTATNKMYLVVDDGNLDSESGYMVYVAGRAAAVDWTGVENKPVTIVNIDTEISGLKNVDTAIGEDIDDLNRAMADAEADLKNVLQTKAPVIINSATGQIATFADGADGMNVKSLKVNMSPIQDLHGYDHPWPAGGGENKFAIGDAVGIAIRTASYGLQIDLDASNETIRIHGTPTWSGNSTYTFRIIATANGYWGPALVDHDYTGYKIFTEVLSKTSNVISAGSIYCAERQTLSVGGFTVADANDVDVTYRMSANPDTAPTEWTPYSNICPISGLDSVEVKKAGKNLLDIPDKTIASEGYIFNDSFDFLPGQYVLSYHSTTPTNLGAIAVIGKDDVNCSVSLAKDNNRIVAIINAPKGIKSIRVYNGAATYTNIQLELGSTSTSYEPYQGETYDITFPTEAGTVYGGTLDVTNGKLVVDRAMVDMGTLTWNASSREATYKIFSTNGIAQLIKDTSNNWTIPLNFICSQYKTTTFNEAYDGNTNGVISYATGNHSINLVDSNFADYSPAEVVTALSGVQLCYELAEPITYTLTPQQLETVKGINHISANGNTTIDVDYCADTKLYIDQKLATAIANALNA